MLVAGYDIRRWEQRGGDTYVDEFTKRFVFLDGFAEPYIKGFHYDAQMKQQVFEWDTKVYGPTHLQYKSPYGFLITWPFCFHIWYQISPKKYDDQGHEIPGSEKVWYFRAGLARWDAGDDKYIVPTWYGPFNLHWD